MRRYSKHSHCPVCHKDHACSQTDDGLILCLRSRHDVSGFNYLGESRDGQWGLYRDEDDEAHQNGSPPPSRTTTATRTTRVSDNGRRAVEEYIAKNLQPLEGLPRDRLADALSLQPIAFDLLPVSFLQNDTFNRWCWVLPEFDGRGNQTAFVLRYEDGQKIARGKRGLTIPDGWEQRPGPVFIPEGASDTLAISAMGLAAVGRPNARGGVEHLADLLAHLPADRAIVILGENDRKADGSWPGRDGALYVAGELEAKLGRPILAALPPEGAKDARAWLNDQGGTAHGKLGRKFLLDIEQLHPQRCDQPATEEPTPTPAGSPRFDLSDLAGPPKPQPAPAPPIPITGWLRQASVAPCCHKVFVSHRYQRRFRILYVSCRRWACSNCAAGLKEEWISNMRTRLAGERLPLYVLHCPEFDWPKVYKRIRRQEAKYFRCVHFDHYLVITTAPLSGAVPIGKQDAADLAERTIAQIPLCRKPISTSRHWQLPKDEPTHEWRRHGQIPANITTAQLHEVCSDAGIELADRTPASGHRRIQRIKEGWIPTNWKKEQVEDLYFSLTMGEYLPSFKVEITAGPRRAEPDWWEEPSDSGAEVGSG